MACTNKDLYKSVRKCPGTIIVPALSRSSWPSRFRRFLHGQSFLILAIPPRDWEELPPIRGDFTLAADAKWHAVDLVALKSSITTETQGEAPSATFLNKAEYIIGGTDADITGFGRMAINDELVYAQQDPNGRFRILGNEIFPVKTTFAQNSGAGSYRLKDLNSRRRGHRFLPCSIL